MKEFIGQGYRELIKLVEISTIIQEILGLYDVPHYSTLCKFASRADSKILNRIFKKTCNLMPIVTDHVSVAAIDSTGFVTDSASYYYSQRTEKLRKDYLKVTISVNAENHSILAMKTTSSQCHDPHVAIQVLRVSHHTKSVEVYVMDKAYDSDDIHDFIHNNLKSDAIIPIRNWNAPYVSGIYRQKMAFDFDYDLYQKRNNA